VSQIAALGISSSALLVAPLASGLALIGVWHPTREATRRLATGALASSYLLAAAIAVRQGMGNTMLLQNFSIEENLSLVVGPLYAYPQLLALLGAWTAVTTPGRRQLLLAIPLGLFLLPLNPLLSSFIVSQPALTAIYWRVLWAVPLPTMLAILFTRLIVACVDRYWSQHRRAALATVLLVVTVTTSQRTTLGRANGTSVRFPGPKVPLEEYTVAETVNKITPWHTTVLAPEQVASWLPSMRGHPPLVVVRPLYTLQLSDYLGRDEAQRRLALHSYLTGAWHGKDATELLSFALDDLHIGTVVVSRNLAWHGEVESVLIAKSFRSISIADYEVWVRAIS